MRDVVIQTITAAAREDRDIMFLSADFGAPALDEFRRDLPDQFVHVGIAEQNMIDLAAGLALSGKKVYCYAMAPFMPARCFEQIKCSLASMNLPVTLIGVGVGLGYDRSSMTHIQVEDIACMRTINHVEILTPADDIMAIAMTRLTIERPAFRYLRLERRSAEEPPFICYTEKTAVKALKQGFCRLYSTDYTKKNDVVIITSGGLLSEAFDAAEILARDYNFSSTVVDVVRVKPFYAVQLFDLLGKRYRIPTITVEEHTLAGGLGATLCEAITDWASTQPFCWPICRLGLHDEFEVVNGNRDELRVHFEISKVDIVDAAMLLIEET